MNNYYIILNITKWPISLKPTSHVPLIPASSNPCGRKHNPPLKIIYPSHYCVTYELGVGGVILVAVVIYVRWEKACVSERDGEMRDRENRTSNRLIPVRKLPMRRVYINCLRDEL